MRFKKIAVLGYMSLSFASQAAETHYTRKVRVVKDEYGTFEIVKDQTLEAEAVQPFAIESSPQMIVEHQPLSAAQIYDLSGSDNAQIEAWLQDHQVKPLDHSLLDSAESANDVVQTIVSSGPVGNRINLVFMGDGYTASEKDKFFADVKRLVNDMFVGQTFTSYLPLFNVHAVFRPSNTSGIGKGSAKDTAYGLYREGDTLRAIFPSNKSALRSSCNAAPACDYPVVIANDPYYGGLGGEFAISTSSPGSGSIVLRHELGHNFGKVGEEYDGGGYFGANFSASVSSVGWSKWTTDAKVVGEPMFARHLSWPWYKLDAGPKTVTFESDGKQAKTWLRLSASGIETSDTLSITLDGKNVPFKSPNRTDRSFINIELPGMTAGKHSLEFAEHVNDHNNWLSSMTVHEYAANFHGDKNYIGAYPVFSESLDVEGYRPTDESCLMRDMEHPFFCPVCQENNWLHFFDKIKLIDSVSATKSGDAVTATVNTLGLGTYRHEGTGAAGEVLDIRWFADGNEIKDLQGKQTWTKSAAEIGAKLEVRVAYRTSEIRKSDIKDTRFVTIDSVD